MKVGAWYSKMSTNQQEAFRRLVGQKDIPVLRGFLTAAQKRFGENVRYLSYGLVEIDGKRFAYGGYEDKDWYEVKGAK